MRCSEGQKPKCSEHTGWGEMKPGMSYEKRGHLRREKADLDGDGELEEKPPIDMWS